MKRLLRTRLLVEVPTAAIVVIAVCLMGALLVGSGSAAHAAQVSNQTFPMSGYAYNTCTNEVLAFQGQFHALVTQTTDGSGGSHFSVEGNFAGVQGVGMSSGTKYVLTQAGTTGLNLTSGASAVTSPLTFTATSLGPAPNEIVRGVLHETITATGDLTVVIDTFSTTCVG